MNHDVHSSPPAPVPVDHDLHSAHALRAQGRTRHVHLVSLIACLLFSVPALAWPTPTIIEQPTAATVTANESVSFVVTASSRCGTLRYQWLKNGVHISGATGSSHSIPRVETSDQGTYSVVVKNLCGSVTSKGALLTVLMPQGPSFAILEDLLQDKVADGSIGGYAVQIFDDDDTLMFESEGGVCKSPQYACPSGNQPFTVDLVTGVASSSKWVTSTVLLAALDEFVAKGRLPSVAAGLDTTVGTVLSGKCGARKLGRGATVTMRQLLSFTSGLLPDHSCVGDSAFTMQQCACQILSDSANVEVASAGAGTTANHAQPPGTVFKYGAAQQVVAAAMVEVATGESYANLFQRLVRTPTGMSATYANPTDISGSMRTSVADYARFVRAMYHAGAPNTLLSEAALAEQEKNQLPAGVLRRSQLQPGLDYGLNTWRWCYRATTAEELLALGRNPEAFTPEDLLAFQDSSCSEIHQQGHGGKGGYQPFVDRPRGFYGVFAMREPSAGGGDEYSLSELSLTAVVRLYAGLVVEQMRSAGGTGETFTLEVDGGYGSGVYAAGQTVHVWSKASTTNEVAMTWGGDSSLLREPNEWHSSFVMPARNVRLVSTIQPQPLSLTVESFKGSTSRPKTVRYFFPPNMRGVVLFSHGTGGSNTFIEGAEPFALALALVHAGYGVIGTEAEEAVAGDLNGDGKERWFAGPNFRADNVDLLNLQSLFASFESRGLVPAGTPKFALGMSAGGAFSHYLGTVGSSPVASNFPQLRFRAVVGYCSDATASQSATLSTTPSAWFMCGAEDNPEVSNTEARANSQTLGGRGIATDYVEHLPSPLYDERFSRIQGISVETSRTMAAELRAAGFVDAQGFLNTDGDAIKQFITANPEQFPTIVSQSDSPGAIRSQLKAMRAEHAMYADYAQRNVAWFERFNPNP